MSNQRTKGLNLERWIVKWVSQVLGIKAYHASHCPEGEVATARAIKAYFTDNEGIDIVFKKSTGLSHLGIQSHKQIVHTKEDKIPLAKLQNIPDTRLPILITQLTRRKGKLEVETGKYITMRLESFRPFLKAYYKMKKDGLL